MLPLSYHREIADLVIFLRSLNTGNGYECTKYLKLRLAGAGPITGSQHHGLTLTVPSTKYCSAQFFPCHLARLRNILLIKIREKLIHLDDKDKIKRVLVAIFFIDIGQLLDELWSD